VRPAQRREPPGALLCRCYSSSHRGGQLLGTQVTKKRLVVIVLPRADLATTRIE
jgi:hypothetical protein